MIEASDEGGEDEEETAAKLSECPAHQPPPAKKGTMTDREIYGNSLEFLLAGNDTTSTALSFTSYLLALHPDIQQRLQSEIDAYFDDKPVSSLPQCVLLKAKIGATYDTSSLPQDSNLYTAAQEITYLDQVLQESLRLYPPGPE